MRFHIQRTNMGWFVLRPRVRIYRRPLLIWVRWFDRSFFFDWGPTVFGDEDDSIQAAIDADNGGKP